MPSISADFSELRRLAGQLRVDAVTVPVQANTAVGRATDWLYSTSVSAAPRLTGELASSVNKQVSAGVGRVVTGARQGFYQEVGTSFHPAQPWLWTHQAAAEAMLEAELDKIGFGR